MQPECIPFRKKGQTKLFNFFPLLSTLQRKQRAKKKGDPLRSPLEKEMFCTQFPVYAMNFVLLTRYSKKRYLIFTLPVKLFFTPNTIFDPVNPFVFHPGHTRKHPDRRNIALLLLRGGTFSSFQLSNPDIKPLSPPIR